MSTDKQGGQVTEPDINTLMEEGPWEPPPSASFDAHLRAAGLTACRLALLGRECRTSADTTVPLAQFLHDRAAAVGVSWEALVRRYGLSGSNGGLTRNLAANLGRFAADIRMPLEDVLTQFRLQFALQSGQEVSVASARFRGRAGGIETEIGDLLQEVERQYPIEQLIALREMEGELNLAYRNMLGS